MMAAAVVFLVVGFYYAYTKGATKRNKIVVWTAASVFLVAVGTPYAVSIFASSETDAPTFKEEGTMQQVLVHVEGMT